MPESDWMADVRTSYDTVAASYAELLRDSLDTQPVVRHVLAWFSIIHVPDEAVRTAFREFRRVLQPGGVLLLGFFVGDEAVRKPQGYGGHPMNVHVHRRPVAWLAEAGFRVEIELVHHLEDAAVPGGMLVARTA